MVTGILEEQTQHDGWNDKVIHMNFNEIQREFDNFNSSVAIPCTDQLGQASIDVQKRLGLKAFYLSNELNLAQYFVTFLVRSYFPFIDPLNNMIHRMHSAGLIDKWMREEDEEIVKHLYATSNLRLKRSDESKLGEFSVPSVVWCGWLCGVIIFICELVWYKVEILIQLMKSKLAIAFLKNV